jgi:hypothetical protein
VRRAALAGSPGRYRLGWTIPRWSASSPQGLIGNTGFGSCLKTISDEHFGIDAAKIEEEKKFDGIFVLRTNYTPHFMGIPWG